MLFSGFLVYDLITAVAIGLITYIFYKIFANSITVICEFGENKFFSIEEVMGASLLIAIAFVALTGLSFWGLSVTNIFSVMLVLFLGWKHGMLVGATSGNPTAFVISVYPSVRLIILHISALVISASALKLPFASPANTPVDRLVEMIPDVFDRIQDFIDKNRAKKEEA